MYQANSHCFMLTCSLSMSIFMPKNHTFQAFAHQNVIFTMVDKASETVFLYLHTKKHDNTNNDTSYRLTSICNTYVKTDQNVSLESVCVILPLNISFKYLYNPT